MPLGKFGKTNMVNLQFYKGKKVLITGHTGFKGAWLCKLLVKYGACVIGYALQPPTTPSLFELSGIEKEIKSYIGDIRDFDSLFKVFEIEKPEIVIHMAAQPLVRDSYLEPKYTYEVNVIGTVNVLECVRRTQSVKSFLNVTTDKVYLNEDAPNHPFKEEEPLDGYDPYSNSKSCSELVTHSYKKSFFKDGGCAISTARAGNVLGGGDFAKDRIIPDCIRAIKNNTKLIVRNPNSTRPYQHVLEPLVVYLEICEKQYNDRNYEGYYNVGPDVEDCINTGELVKKFANEFNGSFEYEIHQDTSAPHEASFLMLNTSKIKKVFNWKPRWHIDDCVKKIVEWLNVYLNNPKAIPELMNKEIEEFVGGKSNA